MTRNTEATFRELLELNRAAVHLLARSLVGRIEFDFIVVSIGDHVGNALTAQGSNDWLKNVARLNASLAVDSAVTFHDAVAGDAGDAFAEHGRTIHDRCFAWILHLSGDRGMAAYAEVADGSLGDVRHRLFKALEHWRHSRVGMRADAPFVINLLMALGTLQR